MLSGLPTYHLLADSLNNYYLTLDIFNQYIFAYLSQTNNNVKKFSCRTKKAKKILKRHLCLTIYYYYAILLSIFTKTIFLYVFMCNYPIYIIPVYTLSRT